jgi:hypothetical protein
MIFGFLLLNAGGYLIQNVGAGKLILNQASSDNPRYVRDMWDVDEWGHYSPGHCIRRVG